VGQPRPTSTCVGRLIDKGLKAKQSDQYHLADACHVSRSYITELRQGRIHHPDHQMLERIAQQLGQDVADYKVGVLADHGDLPTWEKVLAYELGVPVTPEAAKVIRGIVETMLLFEPSRGGGSHREERQ
jgi:transcriptional regulator with XRE-family HTH domain